MAATPSLSPHGRPLTEEEWIALDEDEPGELVDHVLVEEEVPDYLHEVVVTWLARVLGNWLEARGGGWIGGSDAKFLLGKGKGRKPDLSLYLPGGRQPSPRGAIRTPPDAMIEVVSPTPRDRRRDRVEKLADYAAFGVRFYWLVDPSERSLVVHELGDAGRYTHVLGAIEGVVVAIPGCEGLELDLDALWKKLDELEKAGSPDGGDG